MIYDLSLCFAAVLINKKKSEQDRANERHRRYWHRPDNVSTRLAKRETRLAKRRAEWSKYKEYSATQAKVYYAKNREKITAKAAAWVKNNRVRYNKQRRDRYKNDIQFKLAVRLRGRLNQLVGPRKHRASVRLKLNRKELVAHLERLFKPGMTWGNHGTVWHIDHVIPCKSYNLTKPKEISECFSLRNLQPLWAAENITKGAKIMRQTELTLS